jgi:16S rRNA C967 or C1407 C5-methylase (RsmB/RsmF family)
MGRKWSRNKKNKHTGGGKSRDDTPKDPSKYGQERNPYDLVAAGNFKMEAYYAYQGIHDYYLDEESGKFFKCETNEQKEEQRKNWLITLKSILPASFRIGNDVDVELRERLEKDLDEYVGKKMEIVVQPKGGDRRCEEFNLVAETKMIAPAKKLSYIPHAYQLSLDRQTIRRNTNLSGFHEWLKIQTQAGFVTRQETVSMIPPVVLNAEPHHKILDMCAAPGSKTSQLLEIVNTPVKPGDTEPTGYVIANDSDAKRAYMLVHQMRRINSPAVFITTCDAQFFPLIRDEEHPTEGNFDRVLCDVPCSGDGTLRKNPGIWKRWSQLSACGIHALQLAIALKGARLTKVGGYLCYSTCSMNPVENESVVAELLRASEGSLELVDRGAELPGLLARPGMSTWKVLSEGKSQKQERNHKKKNNAKIQARRKEREEKNKTDQSAESEQPGGEAEDKEMADTSQEPSTEAEEKSEAQEGESVPISTPFEPASMDEAELKKMVELSGMKEYATVEDVPNNMRRRIRATLFPPTAEEASAFHLERCMRVAPQDMDTGAFFVALLKKVAPMNARARGRFEKLEEELKGDVDGKDDEKDEEPKVKKAKLEPEASVDVDMEEETNADESKVDDDLLVNEKDSEAVVRGHVKKRFLRGEDGTKHESLGKDDFVPVPEDVFGKLKDFYGLSSDSFEEGQYMIRACSNGKVLYFLSKTVKKLIDQGVQGRLTVVSSGLRGFIRNNKDCEVNFRIAQEGVHFVAPHMTKRKLCANIGDFQKCLVAGTLKNEDFSEDFAKQIRLLAMGSFVVYLEGHENDYIKKLVLVMWRCRSDTVNTLVNQAELDGMKSKVRSVLNEAPVAEVKPKPTEAEKQES